MSRGRSRDRSRQRNWARDPLTSANGRGSRVARTPSKPRKPPLEAL